MFKIRILVTFFCAKNAVSSYTYIKCFKKFHKSYNEQHLLMADETTKNSAKVWIDDKLPMKDGKLVYGHNTEPAEFWVALVEKVFP